MGAGGCYDTSYSTLTAPWRDGPLSCKTRWLDQDDAAAHERLARYCARCPVSLERLEYYAETGTVTYTSDKADGPTAGRHTFEVTDFIARLVAHIPDKGQVL